MKGWKKIFHTNGDQKKAGISVLISDKIDFKTKSEKRQRKALHDDQRINPRRRYNNYKYIYTIYIYTIYIYKYIYISTTICKANANKYERGN